MGHMEMAGTLNPVSIQVSCYGNKIQERTATRN